MISGCYFGFYACISITHIISAMNIFLGQYWFLCCKNINDGNFLYLLSSTEEQAATRKSFAEGDVVRFEINSNENFDRRSTADWVKDFNMYLTFISLCS